MSLLIKALANAEKDKQAELDKTASKNGSAGEVDFELAPIGSEPDEPSQETKDAATENSTPESAPSSYKDIPELLLSLQEEAGLTQPVRSELKSAKVSASAPQTKPQSVARSEVTDLKANQTKPHVNAQKPELAQQKAAAKVFVANQQAKGGTSKQALIALGVGGALLIWLGLQGYQYLHNIITPEVPVAKPAITLPEIEQASALPLEANVDVAPVTNTVTNDGAQHPDVVTQMVAISEPVKAPSNEAASAPNEEPADINQISPPLKREKQVKQSVQVSADEGDEQEAPVPKTISKRVENKQPLRLVSKVPEAGVDPTLLAAYQAYSAGDDAGAQQKYRQVLQRDVRNVDALLGMAAIAQRQGRGADAVGWYQKVLEIEPRNSIAKSGMVASQVNEDVVGTESKIKNMLKQQPEAASLHAALGNLYAEQNQWIQAQEAYFNASRFAPDSADYAFNLAISMEHLGKSDLALAQYQRALVLLSSSTASSTDRAVLEARIRALQ